LTTRREAYEFACTPENGTFKICNGDYGETDWRGINGIILDDFSRAIFSSAAKMNDYYLKAESSAQRQYTMCHEIGHGFGLPHWVSRSIILRQHTRFWIALHPFSTAVLTHIIVISTSFYLCSGRRLFQPQLGQLHGLHHKSSYQSTT
jgi:hypothetical protein